MFFDPEMVVPGRPAVARRGGDRAVVRFVGPVLHADAGEHRQALQRFKMSVPWRGPAQEGCAIRSCTAAAGESIAHALRRRHPPVPDHPSRSKGVIPNSRTAAGRRPIPPGWREELERFQGARASARPATAARLKAPRRWAVKIAGLQHQARRPSSRSATR